MLDLCLRARECPLDVALRPCLPLCLLPEVVDGPSIELAKERTVEATDGTASKGLCWRLLSSGVCMTENRETCLTKTGLILSALFDDEGRLVVLFAVWVPASTPAGRGGLTEGGSSSTRTTTTGCLGDNGGWGGGALPSCSIAFVVLLPEGPYIYRRKKQQIELQELCAENVINYICTSNSCCRVNVRWAAGHSESYHPSHRRPTTSESTTCFLLRNIPFWFIIRTTTLLKRPLP